MERADVALVARGVARSRAMAQRLIRAGAVDLIDGDRVVPVSRASQAVRPEQDLRVQPSAESRFVSRGGAKLDAAMARADIACDGLTALDVGMSTGGFTDCLLARGAARVIGIEVGHGQLAPELAADARVTCVDHTHVRDIRLASLQLRGAPTDGFALIVVDLSFISALGLLDHLRSFAAARARLVALIKPQFELGPKARDHRGIVRAGADIGALRQRALDFASRSGWAPDDWFACALAGGDGNQEYFLTAHAASSTDPLHSHPVTHVERQR